MKKVLALMAVVAMVAISSVAYAQTTATVNGTLGAVSSINSCSATIALAYTSVNSDDCVADSYVSNNAGGTTIDYAAGGAATMVASGTNTALSPVASVTAGQNEWSLSATSTTILGGTASGAPVAPSTGGVQVLAVTSPTDGGNLTLTFDGSVGSTEDSGETYSNVGSLTITQL